MPALNLDGYIRVSRVGGREGEGFISPDVQAQAISRWAEARGHTITVHPAELDVSGGTMRRPIFDQVLERVRSGQTDGFVVYRVDRFARSLLGGLSVLEEVARHGGVFASVDQDVDMTTPQGRAFLQMQLIFAELFRGQVTEAWDTAVARAIGRGVSISVPYGYRRDDGNGSKLVPDEPAASVVRRIYAERTIGRGFAAIADGLNADGIASPRGTWWTRGSLQALVKVRTYLGEAHKGSHANEGAHEPLVDADTWRAAQSIGERGKVQGDGALLSRIVRCAGCGYLMSCGSGGNGFRRYSCGRNHSDGPCPAPTTANAERLEELTQALFLERHGRSSARPMDESNPALVDAYGAEEKAQRAYVKWRDDATLEEEFGEAEYRAGLRARKAVWDTAIEHREDVERTAGASALVVDSAEFLSMPMLEQRALLKRALDGIRIRRAPAPNAQLPERVEFCWIA